MVCFSNHFRFYTEYQGILRNMHFKRLWSIMYLKYHSNWKEVYVVDSSPLFETLNHAVSANRILWVYAGFWWYHGILVVHLQDSVGAFGAKWLTKWLHHAKAPPHRGMLRWERGNRDVHLVTTFVFCHVSKCFYFTTRVSLWKRVRKMPKSGTGHADAIGFRGHIHVMHWNNSSLQIGNKMAKVSNSDSWIDECCLLVSSQHLVTIRKSLWLPFRLSDYKTRPFPTNFILCVFLHYLFVRCNPDGNLS